MCSPGDSIQTYIEYLNFNVLLLLISEGHKYKQTLIIDTFFYNKKDHIILGTILFKC